MAPPLRSVTIVTALIDTGRSDFGGFSRDMETYLAHIQPLLRLDIPMVIFIDPAYKDRIVAERGARPTKVVACALEDAPMGKWLGRATQVMKSAAFREGHPLINHPEGSLPKYNIVTCSKPGFVARAAAEDPFGTECFWWVDAGYGRLWPEMPPTWTPAYAERDASGAVTILQVRAMRPEDADVAKNVFKTPRVVFMGGMFGGAKDAALRWGALYEQTFCDLLEQGVVDDDQTVTLAAYHRAPPGLVRALPACYGTAGLVIGTADRGAAWLRTCEDIGHMWRWRLFFLEACRASPEGIVSEASMALARWREGECHRYMGTDVAVVEGHLLEAWRMNVADTGPLYELARTFQTRGMPELAVLVLSGAVSMAAGGMVPADPRMAQLLATCVASSKNLR